MKYTPQQLSMDKSVVQRFEEKLDIVTEKLVSIDKHLLTLNGKVISLTVARAAGEHRQELTDGAIHSLELQSATHLAGSRAWLESAKIVLQIITLLAALFAVILSIHELIKC